MSKGKLVKSVADMAAEMIKKKTAVLPKEEAEANLKKFLDQSKVQERLYHATPQSFSEFKPGGDNPLLSGPAIWMTPKKESQAAAHNIRKIPGTENRVYGKPNMFTPGTNVMPLYSSLKNPLVSTEKTWKKDFEKFGGSPWTLTPEEVEKIKGAGYDGIVYYDSKGNLEEALAFEPTQVKSAIGNIGTYDIKERDITKAEGGPVKMQDGGAATSNEAMLRRSRRTSKYNRDVDFLDAEMLPEEAPPAEMKAYEPTTRQRLGETAERALRTVSTAPRARAIADLLTGGREGAMMSAADLVPFLGTGMAIEEIAPHVKGALSKGNYGEAALYGGLGVASAIPGIPGTVKGAKAIGKAIAPKAGELAEQYMMRTGMALPIFIGESSKIWNAPAAAQAVKLEKAGVDPVDIWKQTGTFRSPDGALRQEISDVGSKFRGEKEMKELVATMKQQEADIKQKIKDSKEHPDLFPKQLKTAQGELRQQAKDIKARRTMESGPEYRVGLGNRAEFALEHPELYKAYPPLSGMDVQQGGRSGSALGSYIRGIDESDPGMVNIYDRGLANDPRSTMIHEAQHAIQDIEGWGRGGNPEMAFQNPEAHKILEGLRKEASTPLSFDDWYENNFKNSAPYHLFGGEDINQAKKLYDDYVNAVPALAKKFDREYQEQAARLYYERLAGEAESRAAQARRDLTPEQRLEKFPLEVGDYGYDVKPEDIIVKRQKKGGQVSLDAMRLAVGGMAGGGIKASPTKPGQELLGKVGQLMEKFGVSMDDAMKIVEQEGNSPVKAFLGRSLLADLPRSAGTALQDWTGTPRDATEEFPYRRLVSGKGMTTSIDPRVIDVAPIAGSAASRVASGIRHLPTDIMRAATAAYGPQATASYMSSANDEYIKAAVDKIKNKFDKSPIPDKTVQNTVKSLAEKIVKLNPNISEADAISKATNEAIKKFKWERETKPQTEKDYGALVKGSYSDPKTKRLRNTQEAIEERVKKAEEFLAQPTQPWQPPPPELQAFDRSQIKDALEGYPGVEQTRFPRYQAPQAGLDYISEIYDDPRNRSLIQKQIMRGLPLGGETFYASLYPVKQAALDRGLSEEAFNKFIYEIAPASARNSIMNEVAVGQFLRDMNARGIPITEENVIREKEKFKQTYGQGLPIMPVHYEGVKNVIEGNQNLRDLSIADIPTNYKIPTYGAQKAGDFGKSMVLDVHESRGQTLPSRYHPYFATQGGFSPTEYGPAESKMLEIAGELGLPGGMAQAGRWFGGGELTGLQSPRGDALDLLERQVAYTLQNRGVTPTPKNVREYVLEMIGTGRGTLSPWWSNKPMPDVRTIRKKGGLVRKAAGGKVSIDAMRLAIGGGVMSAGQKLAKAFVEAGKKAKLPEQAKEAASKGELFLPDEEVRRMQRELLQGVKKPEEYAEGGSIAASPTIPGQEFLGKIGQAAERLGIKIEDAMKIVSQEGNSPIKAALTNFLVSDTLKSAGTALQDWTGTPRDATEQYPYRRLMTGKGMTASIDPRIIDVAPIAGAAASRAAHGIKHLPTDVMRAAVEAYGPQATASHVIKPKGGNWLSGDVEDRLKRLKNDPVLSGEIINKIANKDLFSEYRKSYEKDPTIGLHDWARSNYPEIYSKTLDPSENALNQWIDKQLTRYVKNEMGTPEDPIRALAEKGTLHYAPQTGYSVAPDLRRAAGMPEGNVATTELGKAWENIADKAILPGTYKTHAPYIMKPGYYSSASEFQDLEKGLREIGGEFAVKNPDAPAYSMNKGVGMEDTGFQHIIDELLNATNPDSGLPRELQLKPESLERLSVPQAVERVAKINEWRAAQKAEADLARANNPATTTFKEYPEGYAWKELKMPEGAEDNKALADALKYEGEQMGHCVGGYCPNVESGESRIYSLRDEKGVPHVTIQVRPGVHPIGTSGRVNKFPKKIEYGEYSKPPVSISEKTKKQIYDLAKQLYDQVGGDPSDRFQDAANQIIGNMPSKIIQIKGRGNAKPAEKYLPFVQDFVKSGEWSDIGDFKNTGMVRIDPESDLAAKIKAAGAKAQNYVTQDELTNLLKQYGNQGNMKKGGRVKSAPSLDAMRLAVMSK